MPILGGELGYQILRRLAPGGEASSSMDGSAYLNRSKVETLLGRPAIDAIRGKRVVDFGCGEGADAIELARFGAARVVGVDIQPRFLAIASAAAKAAGLEHVVSFAQEMTSKVDAVVSIDAFEHFDNPAEILALVANMLELDGRFYVSFGPTWYHPLGGHLFSVFPWAHLLFTESALLRWRADFKDDGARRFSEVAGGLNQMTIGRFEQLVARSPLCFEHFESVPIRRLAPIHGRWTREFTTAIVRATLRQRD